MLFIAVCTVHHFEHNDVCLVSKVYVSFSYLITRQKTSTRPPVRDEYSRISDEWISKSTCPMGRVEFA